jgi:hypothetical protein
MEVTMKNVLSLALVGGLLLAASPAHALSVISGGVGESSRAALESVQNQYNLKVVFTGKAGIYLSQVDMRILDASGNEVVSNVTDGPIVLAELPAGRYTLQANVDGDVRQQKITVGNHGLKTLTVRFPVADDNGGDYIHHQI